jgi:hypothetical protein
MTRGKPLLVAALAVTAGAVFLLSRSDATPPTTAAVPSPSPTAAPSLAATDAVRLATGLTSGDERQVRGVVTVPSDQELDPAAVANLAALGSVAFDLATFHDRGDGRAEVVARDAAQTRWLVGLRVVEERWRIDSAEPAP